MAEACRTLWWEVLADVEGGFCFLSCVESDFQLRFRSRRGASYFVLSDTDPSVKTYGFASFHSVNGHPFVCFADISPNRGISFQGRQDAKRSFIRWVPKVLIITAKVLYSLFFATISAHHFRNLRSVLIVDYEISALCFQGAFFRTALFKTALFYCDRYFLLLPHFLHFALLSAPVYSLLAPVVAIGCFSWFLRVGLLFTP